MTRNTCFTASRAARQARVVADNVIYHIDKKREQKKPNRPVKTYGSETRVNKNVIRRR